MNLQPFVDQLRHELATAAEAGGEEARVLAECLAAPLESAVRLTLFEALATAAAEITRDLAPGAVEVRLRGRDPEFVVTPPADPWFADEDGRDPGPAPDGGDTALDAPEGGSTRINLRLPESLKHRVEETARREHLSSNAWLVRAVAAALDGDYRDLRGRRSGRGGHAGGQRHVGWVR
jgi:hypothetical protein